jgi:hypothetical protein
MIIRPCALFASDLPEDIIDTEDEFIAGGRSVTEAIAGILKGMGCAVDSPAHEGDHGWYLPFVWKKRAFWFQITLIDRYILDTNQASYISKYFKKNKLIYAELLTQFNRLLQDDSRFDNIEWHFLKDIEPDFPGEAKPVSD